jgi:hypothetical protein
MKTDINPALESTPVAKKRGRQSVLVHPKALLIGDVSRIVGTLRVTGDTNWRNKEVRHSRLMVPSSASAVILNETAVETFMATYTICNNFTLIEQ